MEKAEFSETQFVIGYTRELFSSFGYISPFHFIIHAPSTKEEKEFASDLILKHYQGRSYRFSEFYQFKRSKFFNGEVFNDLSGKTLIDTAITPKYGFSIYNSIKTKQFNTLQKLAQKRRYRVYYSAPLFHTVREFNTYFNSFTVQSNSLLFNFSQPTLQGAIIPPGSRHQIIFDRKASHICSDPIKIEGILASERNIKNEVRKYNLETEVKELYNFAIEEIEKNNLNSNFERPSINLFEVREMLLSYLNIHWFPIFLNL